MQQMQQHLGRAVLELVTAGSGRLLDAWSLGCLQRAPEVFRLHVTIAGSQWSPECMM